MVVMVLPQRDAAFSGHVQIGPEMGQPIRKARILAHFGVELQRQQIGPAPERLMRIAIGRPQQFDLIGQVDPEDFKVTRPSFYSELIWDARKQRARADGTQIDWVVLRNRLQHIEARNMRRVSDALNQLAKRVGFRIIPGLGERVIYRELFPAGLTMIDSKAFGSMGLAHVAARQELREMMAALQLPEPVAPLFA